MNSEENRDNRNLTHVGRSPDVPNLAEESGALGVHGVHDGLPCLDLLPGPDPWGVRDGAHPLRVGRHAGGLRDQEPTLRGPLRVVLHGVRLREVAV